MSEVDDLKKFSDDLLLRFDELAQWAVSHWPDRAHPLTLERFAELRAALGALARTTPAAQAPGAAVPDPSAGGPQYVSIDPAPWP